MRWQVWTALLLYVLLRFIGWVHRWAGSFSRLFTLLRATLWMPKDLAALLERLYLFDLVLELLAILWNDIFL